MLKEVRASGKITTKDLMAFMIHHNFSTVGGKLTVLLGVIGLVASPILFLSGDIVSGTVFALVALMYVVLTPLDFYSKALRQVKTNPVFKNEMTFGFTDQGVEAVLYTGSSVLSWDELMKIVPGKEHIFIYIKDLNALVVPKRNFANEEDVETLMAYIREHKLNLPKEKRNKAKIEENMVGSDSYETLEEVIEVINPEGNEKE